MEDPLIHIVRTQQRGTKSTMLQTARRLRTELQRGAKRITSKQGRKRKKEWEKMHGKFPRNLHEKRVDKEQSYGWLKFVDLV